MNCCLCKHLSPRSTGILPVHIWTPLPTLVIIHRCFCAWLCNPVLLSQLSCPLCWSSVTLMFHQWALSMSFLHCNIFVFPPEVLYLTMKLVPDTNSSFWKKKGNPESVQIGHKMPRPVSCQRPLPVLLGREWGVTKPAEIHDLSCVSQFFPRVST